MCMSAEVSATFAAAEFAALGLLWRRGGPSRWFAAAVAPIALQEALQWLLWRHISLDASACDAVNRWATLWVHLIVGGVPVGFTWLAARRSGAPGAYRLLWAIAAYEVLRVPFMVRNAASSVICTTVGPHHHQLWGDVLPQVPPLLGLGIYLGVPAFAVARYLRPARLAAALLLVSGGSLAGVLAYFPVEGESVWCWTCSALLAVGLWLDQDGASRS
jgi:hypothetical protein